MTGEVDAASRHDLASLHPGNFAMVMATGIIALACAGFGWRVAADALAGIALAAYIVLLLLSGLRLWRHAGAVRSDLLNPRMVFSFFTLVAATDIVGLLCESQGWVAAAIVCWLFAFLAWCLLLYLAFSVLTFLSHEHNVNIVHGGWLIAIVGTQSLVLLGARIAPDLGPLAGAMMVEVHMLWGLGLILYAIFVTLFCYRIFFLNLRPEDVSPLLWVVMGAAAISANAGTMLSTSETGLPFLHGLRPFIEGITLLLWAWGTWWIPMLVLFGLWKHAVNRVPLRYEPILWSCVFPLGMYSVASARLGLAADFPPLQWISLGMLGVALLAWSATLSGMLARVGRYWRPASTPDPG